MLWALPLGAVGCRDLSVEEAFEYVIGAAAHGESEEEERGENVFHGVKGVNGDYVENVD